MAEVEKYIPRRINKDFSPESLVGGDRGFLPGDLIDALNVRYFNDGASGISKNIKGNVLKSYSDLPTIGANKVIGVLPNKRDNTIIYFVHNDSGEHRVVEYDIVVETFLTLLHGSSLGFLGDKHIVGSVLDDLVIWAQATRPPCKISLTHARSGFYVPPYAAEAISLGAYPPAEAPIAVKITDPAITYNSIAMYNWQFMTPLIRPFFTGGGLTLRVESTMKNEAVFN